LNLRLPIERQGDSLIRKSCAGAILICLASLFVASLQAQQPAKAISPAPHSAASISEFAWLQGLWTGSLGSAQVEQYFSPVTGGVIVGLFRLIQPQQDPVLEFSTLRDTPDGLELRIRHFDPKLHSQEGLDPIVLRLAQHDGNRFVLENPVNNVPKRSILERKNDTSYHMRAEIVHDNGSISAIEIDWHRQALDLDGPAQPADAPFAKNDLATLAWFAGHWRSSFGGGEVHEFWLPPAGKVMAGALCPIENGKVDGCEFSSLAPGSDALVGRTWQFESDMRITPGMTMIEAPVVSGTAESVSFRGSLPKGNFFTEKVERAGAGGMHKKLEIFKPDGSSIQVIELNANRLPVQAASDKE
jgi:hypothetical protein